MVLEFLFLVHSNILDTVNVIITVKECEINSRHVVFVNLQIHHMLIHTIALDQCVRHLDPKWFHWMTVTYLEHREIFIIVVGNFLFAA